MLIVDSKVCLKDFEKFIVFDNEIGLGNLKMKKLFFVFFELNMNIYLFKSFNVLVFIFGSDLVLVRELVVVMVYYDYIGVINGEVYNGVDDDGFGMVVVLEIV